MKRFLGAFAMGALALVAANASAQADKPQEARPDQPQAGETKPGVVKLSDDDRRFIMRAAEDGMKEVETGRLMAEKTENADVRRFAQMMVEHHTRANDELRQIATPRAVTMPTAVENQLRNRLQKMTGAKADKEYINAMVEEHRRAVDQFQKQSTTAGDPDLRQYASRTLPTLQQHLAEAQRLQETVGRAPEKKAGTRPAEKSGK